MDWTEKVWLKQVGRKLGARTKVPARHTATEGCDCTKVPKIGSLMQPPHTIANSQQDPTPDIPSCESVSKSFEKQSFYYSNTSAITILEVFTITIKYFKHLYTKKIQVHPRALWNGLHNRQTIWHWTIVTAFRIWQGTTIPIYHIEKQSSC